LRGHWGLLTGLGGEIHSDLGAVQLNAGDMADGSDETIAMGMRGLEALIEMPGNCQRSSVRVHSQRIPT